MIQTDLNKDQIKVLTRLLKDNLITEDEFILLLPVEVRDNIITYPTYPTQPYYPPTWICSDTYTASDDIRITRS